MVRSLGHTPVNVKRAAFRDWSIINKTENKSYPLDGGKFAEIFETTSRWFC